jgi:hypothetical protein
MKTGLILPLIVILSLVASRTSAQFSMNATDTKTQPQVRLNLKSQTPVVNLLNNQAKVRALRKMNWRDRNTIDTQIKLTGSTTQFNKSWVNNNQSSVTTIIEGWYDYKYNKSRLSYHFRFDGNYEMTLVEDDWFKSKDWFKLDNLISWKIKENGWGRNWSYSFSTTFSSQFSEGFKSRTEHVIWSNFMAPADLNVGLGITYTAPDPKLPFVITMNPISGNVLFVMDDRLDPERRKNLGIPVSWDAEGNPVFKDFKAEGGSNFSLRFDRRFKLSKKRPLELHYYTTLNSFYGWITDVSKRHLEDVSLHLQPTVGWYNLIEFSPFKFLSMAFTYNLIYDKSQVDKVQAQYSLRIGLTYGYKNK